MPIPRARYTVLITLLAIVLVIVAGLVLSAPLIARHPRDLQALEYVEQMLAHFERVLAAEDRCAAVEELGQEDVRRRLLR